LKLLLDTTYFLPAVGVSIENVPQQAALALIEHGHEIFICDITIFELSAKSGKYIAAGKITSERALRGIRSVIYDERVEKIPLHDTPILLIAFKLRSYLNDFIDCLILSSALNHCDMLVTEDYHLHDLAHMKDFQELLKTINPKFKIQSIKQI